MFTSNHSFIILFTYFLLCKSVVLPMTPNEYYELADKKSKNLVVFVSPYCRFCKELKSTLEVLSNDFNNFHFFEINCVEYNKFCQEQRVHAYPKMQLVDGLKTKRIYHRTYDLIAEQLNKYH
ncbi:Thioredoxin [Entamoeba marina]